MLMVFINYVVCLSAWLGLSRVGLGYSILQLGRRRSRNAHVVLVQVATRQLEILALSFPPSLCSLGKYLFRKAKLHAPTKLSSIISMPRGGRKGLRRGSPVTKRLHSL